MPFRESFSRLASVTGSQSCTSEQELLRYYSNLQESALKALVIVAITIRIPDGNK